MFISKLYNQPTGDVVIVLYVHNANCVYSLIINILHVYVFECMKSKYMYM